MELGAVVNHVSNLVIITIRLAAHIDHVNLNTFKNLGAHDRP